MREHEGLLKALGGEAGCQRLSAAFYARVGKDRLLRHLFPGQSLRCATEEFTAFLIQFLGGDEEQTQKRWWLSLRESHARFQIGPSERSAWLMNMRAALEGVPIDNEARTALHRFFEHSSAYLLGTPAEELEPGELSERWGEQQVLDRVIGAIAAGADSEALALAPRFGARPSVFVGVLARMVQTGRSELLRFVTDALEREPSLALVSFGGRTLLHFAAGAGCLEVVEVLLGLGTDPNTTDRGGHTPLYAVANECGSELGPAVVRALVSAGSDVNACGGVTWATALHMAARRGHAGIARALLDCGARLDARDKKGDTPLQRALNCRKTAVAEFLEERGRTTDPPGTV